MRSDAGARANRDVRTDDSKRADLDVRPKLRGRIDDGARIDHAVSP